MEVRDNGALRLFRSRNEFGMRALSAGDLQAGMTATVRIRATHNEAPSGFQISQLAVHNLKSFTK